MITAASTALGIPVHDRWNDRQYADGTGFLEIGYYPETGVRSSSSVDYLHEIMDDRPNLTMLLSTRVLRVLFDGDRRATGVEVRRDDGTVETVTAAREVVLCAGAIDTPRLLLLSGVGPAGSCGSRHSRRARLPRRRARAQRPSRRARAVGGGRAASRRSARPTGTSA